MIDPHNVEMEIDQQNFGIGQHSAQPLFMLLAPQSFPASLFGLAAHREAQLENIMVDHQEFSLGASVTFQRKVS